MAAETIRRSCRCARDLEKVSSISCVVISHLIRGGFASSQLQFLHLSFCLECFYLGLRPGRSVFHCLSFGATMFFRFDRSSMTSLNYHTVSVINERWTGTYRRIGDTISNVIASACYIYPLLCLTSLLKLIARVDSYTDPTFLHSFCEQRDPARAKTTLVMLTA